MSLRDIDHVSETGKAYTLTLTLNVEDARALWTAAADKALQAGMALSDVLDTIGPREDPAVADCLAMLIAPSAIAGCMLDDLQVSVAASAELIQLPRDGRPVLMSVAG